MHLIDEGTIAARVFYPFRNRITPPLAELRIQNVKKECVATTRELARLGINQQIFFQFRMLVDIPGVNALLYDVKGYA